MSYNVAWWIPAALPLLGIISYRAGTIGFLAMTAARAAINAYRNNALPLEKAEHFPLRSP